MPRTPGETVSRMPDDTMPRTPGETVSRMTDDMTGTLYPATWQRRWQALTYLAGTFEL